MANIIDDSAIFMFTPDKHNIGVDINDMHIDTAHINNLYVNSINGGAPFVGAIVTEDAVQTITNKSLVDNSTTIISDIDDSQQLQFNLSNNVGKTTIQLESVEDRTINIPAHSSSYSEFVLTTTDQTITGMKTFNDLTANAIYTNNSKMYTTTLDTSGATATLCMINIEPNTVVLIAVKVIGVDSAGNAVVFEVRCVAKNNGALLKVSPLQVILHSTDVIMESIELDVQVAGSQCNLLATGLPGAIKWSLQLDQTTNHYTI